MTTHELCTSLRHIAAELDRLRLRIADRLSTHEEAALLGLIFGLETVTDRLPTPAMQADDTRVCPDCGGVPGSGPCTPTPARR